MNLYLKITTAISCILLISACSSEKNSNVHPNDRNLPSASEANIINLNEKKSGTPTEKNVQLIADLKNRKKVAIVGNDTDEEGVIFGRVDDVVIDSTVRIYVLDSKKLQIQVFDSEGEHLTSVGNRGPGPGEFKRSTSMSLYKDSGLAPKKWTGYPVSLNRSSNSVGVM